MPVPVSVTLNTAYVDTRLCQTPARTLSSGSISSCLQRQPATAGHGISCIHREVHDDLFDLADVHSTGSDSLHRIVTSSISSPISRRNNFSKLATTRFKSTVFQFHSAVRD